MDGFASNVQPSPAINHIEMQNEKTADKQSPLSGIASSMDVIARRNLEFADRFRAWILTSLETLRMTETVAQLFKEMS